MQKTRHRAAQPRRALENIPLPHPSWSVDRARLAGRPVPLAEFWERIGI